MERSKKIFICIAVILFSSSSFAETLFEIKDSLDNKVLDVSTDGLRVMNLGDTLMVISASEIKANLDNSKGLSRSFSVTTTSSVKGLNSDIMRLTADSTRFWVNDAGKGFKVASKTATVNKALADTSYMNLDKYNSFVGLGAGYKINPNTSYINGNKYNTMFGYQAGFNTFGTSQSTEASYNVFIGYKSGWTNSSGSGNIYIGNQSGYSGINNSNNTFLGTYSGQQTGGSYNTFMGYSAGQYNTSGARNTFVGHAAGSNNTSGSYNASFGGGAGSTFNGNNNVFMGYSSGVWYNGGATGNNNVMIGYYAGSNSTAVGQFAGSNNVLIGYQAGLKTVTGTFSGTGNILIGNQAGSGSQKYSDKLFIENSNADSLNALIWGDFANNKLKFNGTVQLKNGTEIGKVQAGTKTIGTGYAGVNTVTLTFPSAFSVAPKVNVTPHCADGITTDVFVANVRNITTTSCIIMIYRLDSPGSSWGQNLKVDWFAWE